MKKIIKNPIFMFILGTILFVGIGVTASAIFASDIGYTPKNPSWQVNNVKDAIDELYARTGTTGAPKKFCELKSGNALTIGSKYECNPGDGTKRNFYVLAVGTNNVKLIMEHNITEGSGTTTMTWMNAMKYFRTGAGVSIKNAWTNVVDIDLPIAQDIANAVGNTGWNMEDKNSDGWFCLGLKDQASCSAGNWTYATDAGKEAVAPYKWLFNYTRECTSFGCDSSTSLGDGEAYGYWTRDVVAQQKDSTGRAWNVDAYGNFGISGISRDKYSGIRPVITVLKSNLY